jgi:hypothetical protein
MLKIMAKMVRCYEHCARKREAVKRQLSTDQQAQTDSQYWQLRFQEDPTAEGSFQEHILLSIAFVGKHTAIHGTGWIEMTGICWTAITKQL